MTDFMLVLGAYAATLRAWSGQDDIRVATMLANRVEPGMDEVVGFLTNTTVLRIWLGDTDPVAVSRQGRAAVRAALQASNHVQGAGRRAVRRDHDRRTDHRDGPT